MDDKELHNALPVSGYRPQSQENVDKVNGFKADEERLLRRLDDMKAMGDERYDQRWLAVARTHFEQGYMALNRSVFRPARTALEGDGEPEA